MHNDDHSHAPQDDQRLDELLEQSRWEEPSAEQIVRLGEMWRQVRAGQSQVPPVTRTTDQPAWHTRVVWFTTAAALVGWLLAGGLAWNMWADEKPIVERPKKENSTAKKGPESVVPSPRPNTPDPHRTPTPPPRAVANIDKNGKNNVPTIRSRSAKPAEAMMFRLLTGSRKPRRSQQEPAPLTEALGTAIEKAVDQLTDDAEADVTNIADSLPDERRQLEHLLLLRLTKSVGEERIAVLKLLGQVGSRRSLPALITAADGYPLILDSLFEPLVRLADANTLKPLLEGNAESESEMQAYWLRVCLQRGDVGSVALALDFVSMPAHSDIALQAVEKLERLPVAALFTFLRAPQQPRRTAAAMLLGHASDPRVAAQLMHMVQHNVQRREALLALDGPSRPHVAAIGSFSRSRLHASGRTARGA